MEMEMYRGTAPLQPPTV